MYGNSSLYQDLAANPCFGEPSLIEDFLDNWEAAKAAYEKLILRGLNRSDRALAKDPDYARLLRAGQKIHMLGGQDALLSIARRLGRSVDDGSACHFERLWQGLLPAQSH